MTVRTATAGLCFALCCLTSFGQQLSKPIAYDVVTIRENKSGQSMSSFYGRDTYTAENAALGTLIESAYELRADQIVGLPSWGLSLHFDVKAKIVEADPEAIKDMPQEQRRRLLQQVLAQRFHLKTHTETRQMPTYDLVPANSGVKLQPLPATEASGRSGFSASSREIRLIHGTIPMFVAALADQLQRTVTDKTGLGGRYSFTLKFANDNAAPDGEAAASLFTALQEELGLRLQPSRGPVEVLVIDHAEQPARDDN